MSILNITSAPFISSETDQSDSVSSTVNTLASLDADPARVKEFVEELLVIGLEVALVTILM